MQAIQVTKEIFVPLEEWFTPDSRLALPIGIVCAPNGQWVAYNLAKDEYEILDNGQWVETTANKHQDEQTELFPRK